MHSPISAARSTIPLSPEATSGCCSNGPSRAARQLTAIYPALRTLGLCYGDSGIFIRRTAYDRIGGPAIALFEDLELLRRMRKAGRSCTSGPGD